MKRLLCTCLLLVALASRLDAQEWEGFDLDRAESLAVYHAGEVRTLGEVARGLIYELTRDGSVDGQEPIMTLFDMLFLPERWRGRRLVRVTDNPDVRKLLPLETGRELYSPDELVSNATLMGQANRLQNKLKQKQTLTHAEQEILRLHTVITSFKDRVLDWRVLCMVPPSDDGTRSEWCAINDPLLSGSAVQVRLRKLLSELETGYVQRKAALFNSAIRDLEVELRAVNASMYPSGVRFHVTRMETRFQPMRWGLLGYIAALSLFGLALMWGKATFNLSGYIALCLGVALHATCVAMHLRVEYGREASMGEHLLQPVPIGALVLLVLTVIGLKFKNRWVGLAGGLLGCAVMAYGLWQGGI